MIHYLPFMSASFCCVLLMGCDSGIQWSSGDYKVYWIDKSADLTLGIETGNGASIGRVMPRVFAVGENDTWVVAGRHPAGDTSIQEYFYFPKAGDHPHKNADEVVLGPFTTDEFEKLKAELDLPNWSRKF